MIANFDLFDKQPNTMVGTPNDIYGEVGNQHFGVSPGSADPNYGYANTDMGGGMQDVPTDYSGLQFGIGNGGGGGMVQAAMPAMPAMPIIAPPPANARERTVVSVGELHQLHANTAALTAHSTQLKISMEHSKAHMAAEHDSQITQLAAEHEHVIELMRLEHQAALREKDRDMKEKELEIEALKRDHQLELKRRDGDLQEVYDTHKQTIADIENVVASETEQHHNVLSQLSIQHKQTIQQIEDVVQAETQEHMQVLAQAEQNGEAQQEVVGQFEKMAISRQDVTQQLKQRMDQYSTRVRVLEREIAAAQEAEHVAFNEELQYWQIALRAARDTYEIEMESLETKYFGVCRQGHIVVPADMILMKKNRKTDRVASEAVEAERVAFILQKKASTHAATAQRLQQSDQEHTRVWEGKAVQRDLAKGDQSVSDLQRKVQEARVRANMASTHAASSTMSSALTKETLSRANKIEQMAQDARTARDNAYAGEWH